MIGEDAVALADIAVIVTGTETTWGASVVAEAARFDVPIITCDWRGVPIACTIPWSDASRIGARHRAQVNLSGPRQKNAWMQVVRAKIRGQASNLAGHDEASATKLRSLVATVRSGDTDNVEARAARLYWARLFPAAGFARANDGDDRNALLNYGYAILRGYVVRSIVLAGLSPALGIWHRNRANAFALADDLIEPFRPAIDHVVSGLSPNASLEQPETKHTLVATMSLPMGTSGQTVATAISTVAQAFARYAERETARLVVPAWQPADG